MVVSRTSTPVGAGDCADAFAETSVAVDVGVGEGNTGVALGLVAVGVCVEIDAVTD